MPIPVKTGFTPPPMPGMPAPMQPMMPMGGPGTFPAAPLPAGQTPVPPSMPPLPLAGFPPPPAKSPMAQQGSNAPRRRRFGDSLEGMLGRNIFATQQQRPLPMPQQQRMVAPGTPMMRTPTPRPMQMGGIVPRQTNVAGQPHGLAYINQDEEALLRSFGGSGIAGPGGIPSYPPRGVTSGGSSGASSSFDSGYKPITTNYKDDDDKPSSYSAFDDDYEDFTPTSDQLNQQLSDAGQTNITSDTSNVNFGTTSSGRDFTTAAQADTDVSGAEFVAAGGLGTGGSGASTAPPSVGLGSTESVTTYTDMLGNTHSSAADRDRANLAIQQQMYGSGNQAAKNIQQQLYKQYAEQFPEGKRMEGDSEELGRMGADVYLKYTPEINELLGPQGLPNQPFDLPFSFSGIEGITPRGSEDSPDQSSQVDVGQSGVGLPSGLGLPSEQDIGLGFGSSDYPDMSMTAIPGATTPMGYFPEDPGTGFPSSGTTAAGTDPNQFPVEEIQSMFPPKDDKDKDKDDKSGKLTPEELEKLKASLGEQVPISGVEKIINQVIGSAFFGLGSDLADRLRASSEAERRAIVDQHLNALNSGATPVYNDKGEYVGFDMSTMDTFADKVLAAGDIMAFMPPSSEASSFTVTQEDIDALRAAGFNERADELKVGQVLNLSAFDNPAYQADADGDGVPDFERFHQIMDAQSEAAKNDPFGQSTEQGFITSDGREFFVDATGNVVEVEDGVVPFEIGGGDDVIDIFSTTTKDDGGDSGSDTGTDTGPDTGHTVDENGNIVCNTEGYIYNPETKVCEPPKEEEEVDGTPGSGINRGTSGESFEDVLKRVVVAAPDVAPISANVRPMQEGGMAGLNRAADNFLKALAG